MDYVAIKKMQSRPPKSVLLLPTNHALRAFAGCETEVNELPLLNKRKEPTRSSLKEDSDQGRLGMFLLPQGWYASKAKLFMYTGPYVV